MVYCCGGYTLDGKWRRINNAYMGSRREKHADDDDGFKEDNNYHRFNVHNAFSKGIIVTYYYPGLNLKDCPIAWG